MKTSLFLSLFLAINVRAELPPEIINSLSSDLINYNRMQAEGNIGLKNDNDIIAEENNKYLKMIKEKVSKKEYQKIDKEIKQYQNADDNDINKQYLKRIKLKDNQKLSKENVALLNKLVKSTSAHLKKGFQDQFKLANVQEVNRKNSFPNAISTSMPLSAKEDINLEKENRKFISSDSQHDGFDKVTNTDKKNNDKDLEILNNSIRYIDANPNRYQTDKNDSIFEIITKTHIRNFNKLREH